MSDQTHPPLRLSQRIPPSNIQAEQALLGALMANPAACRHVADMLEPYHFTDPVHGAIFEAIMRGFRAKRLVDTITLRAEFEHTGLLDEVGGAAYLDQLTAAAVGIIDPRQYGLSIRDASIRRELIDIGEDVVNAAFGGEPALDGYGQAAAATSRLLNLAQRSRSTASCDGAQLVGLVGPEIEQLCRFHVETAGRLSKLQPVPQGMFSWHAARAEMFQNLLQMDKEDIAAAADSVRDPMEVRSNCDIVDGNVVVMNRPEERPSL